MVTDFTTAFKLLIGHEGGYQNSWFDRGNWTSGTVGVGKHKGTKYGISAMRYPYLDIEKLNISTAKRIYKRDYWDVLRLDTLPPEIRFQMFDTAVNSGVRRAARLLQAAVNVKQDGNIGPLTLTAVGNYAGAELVSLYAGERLLFLASLSVWKRFSKGWARRVAKNLILSARH